jgi:hypothetical protein
MKNLVFSDLYSLVSAITSIKGDKIGVAAKAAPTLPWNLPNGFLAHLFVVKRYYDKHFQSIPHFDEILSTISEKWAEIPEDDCRQAFIDLPTHRKTLLDLIDAIELFEQQIFQHYSTTHFSSSQT